MRTRTPTLHRIWAPAPIAMFWPGEARRIVRLLALATLAAFAATCSRFAEAPPIPPAITVPYYHGIIINREQASGQDGMTVQGDSLSRSALYNDEPVVWFGFGSQTRVWQVGGTLTDTKALTVGRVVSVHNQDLIIETYPPQTPAIDIWVE